MFSARFVSRMAPLTIILVVAAISSLASAQSSTSTSSTCAPAAPLQTAWKYELPVKNPGKDFGPPNVPQGKSWQGQPKKVKKTKGKKIRNVGCVTMLSSRYILISLYRVRDFLRSTRLVTDFGPIVIITIPDGFGPASEVNSQCKSHLFRVDTEDRFSLGTSSNGRILRWGGTKSLVRHHNVHIGIKLTY